MSSPAASILFGLARSVNGASHRRVGKGCDDASLLWTAPRAFVIAVCDGAGSAPLAHEGAAAASKAAVDWLRTNAVSFADPQWRKHLARGVARVGKRVAQRAHELNAEPRDLATTLLIATAWPYGVLAAQVGDGALIVQEEVEGVAEYRTLLRAPREHVSNATHFVTDHDADQQTRFVRWRGELQALVAMTDGLENLAIDRDGRPYRPFIEPLLHHLRVAGGKGEARKQLRDFLRSDSLQSRTDDDVSLAVGLFQEPIYD